jgi:hypothetical protein
MGKEDYMARTAKRLPDGRRISDVITLGVLAKSFPLPRVKAVLASTGSASLRERDLPAHVMVYYVMAMTLCMQFCCREVLRWLLQGAQWLLGPEVSYKVVSKSGISQARTRLGWESLKQLHDEIVGPLAGPKAQGAWYRSWRLVALDGSTLEVADTAENARSFGRPKGSRGTGGYPHLRFVALVESGTHVLFGSRLGSYNTGEITLAKEVVNRLEPGMLCLADRNFTGCRLWMKARSSGAELLWRAKGRLCLPCCQRLADGSYLSCMYPSKKDRHHNTNGVPVRVIDYRLERVTDSEPFYRLVTSILDPEQAPAEELAALYAERWEIETALDELKNHLRGPRIVLRSKTPELVRQEFYALLMAHFAVRGLMQEAALQAHQDPDRLSFVHAVRVVRRKLPLFIAFPPGGVESSTCSDSRRNPAGADRLQPRASCPERSQAQDYGIPSPAWPDPGFQQNRVETMYSHN